MSKNLKFGHDWLDEKEITSGKQGWKEEILNTVRTYLRLSNREDWADKVGFKKNEVQIQFKDPINNVLKYAQLGLMWVQFNVWNAQTKTPSTRVVRFGPDVASLMVLVKSGSEIFLLARRKYQFAGKDNFTEFSRGWINDAIATDQGWKLFERDFPGLKDSPLVTSITEKPMGSPIWENNSEYANKISHHLVVVTLSQPIKKEDLEKYLISIKLKQEYPEIDTENLDGDDLVSQPVVMEIHEAAKYLNAHLEGNEIPLAMFGESYSIGAWLRFLSKYGRQLDILPVSELV